MNCFYKIFAILILLCVNVLAQQDINSAGINTIETFNNDQIIYQNGAVGVNAGPYLALEGFEDAFFPPAGWELFTENIDWEQTDFEFNGGNYSAVINLDCETFNDAWLITPEIDLITATDPFLNYYEYVEIEDMLEGDHLVLISTDYDGSGDPSSFTWDEINFGVQDLFSWELRELDLSSYIGQTVYIAFEYIGVFDDFDCGTIWFIDDVVVDELCAGSEPIPNCATISSPPDGATLCPTFTSLFWNPPGADATKQFLYFGTDGGGTTTPTNFRNGSEFSENVIGIQFLTLTPNTTYYWQIKPANCSQTAVNCPIWSFTTNDGEVNFGGGNATQGGYFWANSTAGASGAPSQPTFSWVDISGTGTDLIGSISDNSSSVALNIGFTFNYFGTNYTQFFINSNGFITFTNPSGQTNFGFPIPALNLPDNIIAGYWADLDPTNTSVTGQHLYYGLNNGDMVITFEHYPEKDGDANGWITFQIIIKPSGNIKIQYQISGSLFDINAGVVGIENSDGTKGITYKRRSGGGAIFGSPLALEFGLSSSALPVELSSFSAVIVNGGVKLNWRTETEVSNYGFEIQRAISNVRNIKWLEIGFVEGHGNSNSPKEYSFVDNNVTSGKYSYRLKQIDNDGKFEYSKVIEINVGTPIEYELSQNYPNPFNPSTTIKFSIPEKGNVNLLVYNILGEKVATLLNEVKEAGVHTINFDASELKSGIYFYKLQAGSFIQTKKMMLLK